MVDGATLTPGPRDRADLRITRVATGLPGDRNGASGIARLFCLGDIADERSRHPHYDFVQQSR